MRELDCAGHVKVRARVNPPNAFVSSGIIRPECLGIGPFVNYYFTCLCSTSRTILHYLVLPLLLSITAGPFLNRSKYACLAMLEVHTAPTGIEQQNIDHHDRAEQGRESLPL